MVCMEPLSLASSLLSPFETHPGYCVDQGLVPLRCPVASQGVDGPVCAPADGRWDCRRLLCK